MTTRAVRVWDAFLVWLGVQSRHRSSLTATRIPGHTPRHAFTDDDPQRTGHQIPFTPRQNGKLTALARHHGMTTVQASDLFRANLRHEPAPDTSQPRPGSLTEMGQKIADGLAPWTWTDRSDDTVTLPTVDWVTEEVVMPKGTKIPGWVAPVTGTYQIDGTHPPVLIKDEPHYGLIDYLDRYGSATKIGGAT